MTEIEQLLAAALEGLAAYPHLTAWNKWLLCGRLADMCHEAEHKFFEQDSAEEEAAWPAENYAAAAE